MEEKKVTLEISEKQFKDLVKLIRIGSLITEEISEDHEHADFSLVQQKILSASGPGTGNLFIGYDKKDDEYFLAEDLEKEILDILDEYDEIRFWETLVMRLSLRDMQKKFTDKELKEMPEEKGNRELESIHDYYVDEFDKHDLDHVKIVPMKRV